jgi:ferredoxin
MASGPGPNDYEVDETLCCGCGTCSAIAEDYFTYNELTEKGNIVDSAPDPFDRDVIQDAINTCPEEAIKWTAEVPA